jgi:hypothetical protein
LLAELIMARVEHPSARTLANRCRTYARLAGRGRKNAAKRRAGAARVSARNGQ